MCPLGIKLIAILTAMLLWYAPAAPAETSVETYNKMTPEQRVGQVFIWTYAGTSFSPFMERWLGKYQPGGLIVFSRNIQSPEQIARVNAETQNFAAKKMSAPLFLMIDQEGGPVTRLKTSVPLPSALALGTVGDHDFVKNFAKTTAQVLHDVGFNVNLAPVMDISNPKRDSFIGNRAFGKDPKTVAEIAAAYAEGINDGGMIPTAKHFPGHGGVTVDSHHVTPKKLASYDDLAEKDLVPFANYAHLDFPRAMMMAHIALPNIDPSGVPSTFSKILIEDNLRKKLAFDGLVITDDLEMIGASVDKDFGERAIRAFLAGNDMLMFAGSGSHQKHAFEAMLAAVNSGRISTERLKTSVLRILSYKQNMKLGPVVYNEKQTKAAIVALESLSKEVLKKNFEQSLAGKTAQWPEVKPDTETLVLSADWNFYSTFKRSFRGKARHYLLTPDSLDGVAAHVADDKYPFVVYYASGKQSARWLAHLPSGLRAKTIVINANHWGEVDDQDSFLSVLNINTRNSEAGSSLAEMIGSPDVRVPADEEQN